MPLKCPKCHTDLPEQSGLEYRFCPRCGAGITEPADKIEGNFQTIPPDLHRAAGPRREQVPKPERIKKAPADDINQTLEPEITAKSEPRPEILPPPGSPPPSFYRADSSHPISRPESGSIQDKPSPEPRKLNRLLIIIGVITILIGGVILWFLV